MTGRHHTENMSRLLDAPTSIINVLGVVYAHTQTSDGGDLYLTPCGLPYADLLQIENWYEKSWFTLNRVRLTGTSSVFRVPTKVVNGQRLQLVVKNSRVGEDVPLDTHTLYEFLRAEFNSPWEEFALVMELREGAFGPQDVSIQTQQPLAIYVPPERTQMRHTGRSRDKMQRIVRRHPGIDLDILRQYILVYQWIEGVDMVQAFREIRISQDELVRHLTAVNKSAIERLRVKGFAVADMKPSHIIVEHSQLEEMRGLADGCDDGGVTRQCEHLHSLMNRSNVSIVDYELLLRTPEHEQHDVSARRSSYLRDQCERFKAAPLPPFLVQSEIMDVPYVHGYAESTGGLLWVVGRNANLFDYFLPERWRACSSKASRKCPLWAGRYDTPGSEAPP